MAPGESRKIIVKMTPRSEKYHKEIQVETNDPKADIVILTVKAQVIELMKILPKTLNFRKISPGQSSSLDLTIENTGKKAIKFSKLSTVIVGTNKLTVSPAEPFTLSPGEKKKLEVTLKAGSSTGYISGEIILETNIESLPKTTVHIHAQVIDN